MSCEQSALRKQSWEKGWGGAGRAQDQDRCPPRASHLCEPAARGRSGPSPASSFLLISPPAANAHRAHYL